MHFWADILAQAKVTAPSQIIRNSIPALRSELRSEQSQLSPLAFKPESLNECHLWTTDISYCSKQVAFLNPMFYADTLLLNITHLWYFALLGLHWVCSITHSHIQASFSAFGKLDLQVVLVGKTGEDRWGFPNPLSQTCPANEADSTNYYLKYDSWEDEQKLGLFFESTASLLLKLIYL